MKEEGISGACCTSGEKQYSVRDFGGPPFGSELRWYDSSGEIVWKGVDWIYLAQDVDK